MKFVNRLLARVGIVILPVRRDARTTGKMLQEHANISEHHHPSRGGNTVRWMRRAARWIDY